MLLYGQPKISPFCSQRETIQIPISIHLWLQVTAFWGKAMPSLSLPGLWLDSLKPMEQEAELAAASAPCLNGSGGGWGGVKQKGKLKYVNTHTHKKRLCG